MARQVFYSFHYSADAWRASQIRNIGSIEGNRPAPDNDWESITRGGDVAIQRWIDDQMRYRSTTIVLVGANTAGRKWIDYEILKSWNSGMGLLGINIHRLKNSLGSQSYSGTNPFDHVNVNGTPMSQIVRLYNPPYLESKDVYNYIAYNIESWTEEANRIRARY